MKMWFDFYILLGVAFLCAMLLIPILKALGTLGYKYSQERISFIFTGMKMIQLESLLPKTIHSADCDEKDLLRLVLAAWQRMLMVCWANKVM